MTLQNELSGVQSAKQIQLNRLAQQDTLWTQLNTQEGQLTERITEHIVFKETLEEMINGKPKQETPGSRKKRTPKKEPESK